MLCVASNRSLAADTISASYLFGANSSSPSWASADADASSSATDITTGSGFPTTGATPSAGISTTSGTPIPALYLRGAGNSTEALAYSSNKYIQFTITPTEGALSFSSLSFDFNRDVGTSAKFYALYFSTNGSFTSGSHIDANSTAFSSTASWTHYNVALSDMPAFQSVAGTATFRLYFWGGGGATTDIIRLDNITVNTAAIPEPSSYALAASACLFLFALCRRNQGRSVARRLCL